MGVFWKPNHHDDSLCCYKADECTIIQRSPVTTAVDTNANLYCISSHLVTEKEIACQTGAMFDR